MTKRKATKKTPTKRVVSFSQKELEKLFLKQLENESNKQRRVSVSNKPTKNESKTKQNAKNKIIGNAPRTFQDVRSKRREVSEVEEGVKVVKVKPVVIYKAAISKIRKQLRKKDGTYFSERYYKNILKKMQGKTTDEADDVLIALRNANPNVRYYKDSSVGILHYQVGNFVDRLSGKANTENVTTKGKRKGKKIVTGEVKRGTSISITDLLGDETETTSIVKANDIIANQNRYINKVLETLSPKEDRVKTKRGKTKGSGIYVIITEITTSNSEGEVTRISYNYYTYEVQGVERALFADLLDEYLHNG